MPRLPPENPPKSQSSSAPESAPAACKTAGMAEPTLNGSLEEINRLILDTMVTVERAQDLAKSVQNESSVPSPISKSALFEMLLVVTPAPIV